jgi:hypothetical protein
MAHEVILAGAAAGARFEGGRLHCHPAPVATAGGARSCQFGRASAPTTPQRVTSYRQPCSLSIFLMALNGRSQKDGSCDGEPIAFSARQR